MRENIERVESAKAHRQIRGNKVNVMRVRRCRHEVEAETG